MKPLHLRREASKAIVKTLVTFSLGGLFGLWLASLLSSKALNSRISRLSKEIDFAESTEKQDSDQHWENAIWKRGPTGDGQSKGVGSAPDKIHTEQSVPKASGDTKIVNSDPNTLRKDAFSPSTQGSKQLRATDETSTAGMAVSHHESDNSKELTSQERQQQIQSTTASNSNPSQPSIEEKTLEQAQSAKVSADSQEGTTQTSMTKASAEVGNGLPAEQKQESLPLPPHAKPATPSTLNPLKSPHPVASLLRSWDNNGPMPRALVIALRNLAVEDLVSQIMKAHSEELQKYTVVDVGANNGFPVTRFALMRTVGRIISVDPDERNLKTLEKIYCPKDTTYTIFRGAAGRTPGKQTMMFSNTLDTSACFATSKNCLDIRKKDVTTREIQVTTVTTLVQKPPGPAQVLLLKTDTQGFEADVLTGAVDLMKQNKIRYVILEYDVGLLRTPEIAAEVLELLLSNGFSCSHVRFDDRKIKKSLVPGFADRPFTWQDILSFRNFVKGETGYTNVFCGSKRYQH